MHIMNTLESAENRHKEIMQNRCDSVYLKFCPNITECAKISLASGVFEGLLDGTTTIIYKVADGKK